MTKQLTGIHLHEHTTNIQHPKYLVPGSYFDGFYISLMAFHFFHKHRLRVLLGVRWGGQLSSIWFIA